jgi:hypothetical protein
MTLSDELARNFLTEKTSQWNKDNNGLKRIFTDKPENYP